jgi:two-component system, OmpR family, response regulator
MNAEKRAVVRGLVVDDEAGIRELIRTVAAMKGYETLEAETGQQALEIAHRFACDLIITDQEMPCMKGLELIARLTFGGLPGPLSAGFRLQRRRSASCQYPGPG